MFERLFKIALFIALFGAFWIAWGSASNGRYAYDSGTADHPRVVVLDTRTGTVFSIAPPSSTTLEIPPQAGEAVIHYEWSRK
jgi:hypothetical protein